MHIRHGELWVKRLAESAGLRDEAERTFHKWYVRTMNIFGRPGPQEPPLPGARAEAAGQRRGPPDVLGGGPGPGACARLALARVEAGLGNPSGGGPDPGLTGNLALATAPFAVGRHSPAGGHPSETSGLSLLGSIPMERLLPYWPLTQCPIRGILSTSILAASAALPRASLPPKPRPSPTQSLGTPTRTPRARVRASPRSGGHGWERLGVQRACGRRESHQRDGLPMVASRPVGAPAFASSAIGMAGAREHDHPGAAGRVPAGLGFGAS